MIFGAFEGHGVVFFFFWGHLFEGLSGSFFDFGGVILGALRGHFGDLGGSLGDFLDVFSRVGKKEAWLSYRRALLEAKVAQRTPKWVPSWSQNGPKINRKNNPQSLVFFGWVFGSILVDSGWQNGINLVPKSDPKSMLALKRKNQLNASPLVAKLGSENPSWEEKSF